MVIFKTKRLNYNLFLSKKNKKVKKIIKIDSILLKIKVHKGKET